MKRIIFLILMMGWLVACSPDQTSPLNTRDNLEEISDEQVNIPLEDVQNEEALEDTGILPMPPEDPVTQKILFHPQDYVQGLTVTHKILTVGKDYTEIRLAFRGGENALKVLLMKDQEIIKTYESVVSTWQFDQRIFHTHRVTFDGLMEGTDYTYVILEDQQRTDIYPFRSMTRRPRVLFIGDIQGYKASQYEAFAVNVSRALEASGPFDFIYIAGDIVDTSDSLEQWDFFFENIAKLQDQIFVTAVGNHDVYITNILYENAFNYPVNGLIDHRHFYFESENTLFMMLDTEYFEGYTAQVEWMGQIGNSDKHQVVLMHRSMYPVKYNESYIRDFADDFEGIGIDLVLSGHDHIYSRTRIKEGELSLDEGIVYIIGGSGSGSKFYDQDENRSWLDVVYDEDLPVYTVIDFNETIQIQAYALDEDIRLIDTLEIK